MPKISALIHVNSASPRLGSTLDSLRCCDEIIVVDHCSPEECLNTAREHGARVVKGVHGVDHGAYALDVRHDWIFCLLPFESMDEQLEASVLEWKDSKPPEDEIGYKVRIREQNGTGWKLKTPELRLANRKLINWTGDLPPETDRGSLFQGHILRIPNGHDVPKS